MHQVLVHEDTREEIKTRPLSMGGTKPLSRPKRKSRLEDTTLATVMVGKQAAVTKGQGDRDGIKDIDGPRGWGVGLG